METNLTNNNSSAQPGEGEGNVLPFPPQGGEGDHSQAAAVHHQDSRVEGARESYLDMLSPEEEQEFHRWVFDEKLDSEEICSRFKKNHAAVITQEEIDVWRECKVQERQCRKMEKHCETVNRIMANFKEQPSNTYEALTQLIGEALFDYLGKGERKLEELGEATKIVISVQGLKLKERETVLEETKQRENAAMQLAKLELADKAPNGKRAIKDSTRADIETKLRFF